MTDEEFAKLEKTIEEVDKWWNSLSEEEKKKEAEKKNTLGFGKIGRIVTL